jgi:hypothetical protein
MEKMIFGSLMIGLRRAWAAKRMLFIYYFANLICGVILAAPLRSLLREEISQTMLGEALGGRFDMNFFADFIANFKDFGATWSGLVMILPIFYLLSNLFLSGGALSVFATGEKYSTALFWSGSARYFGRFLRLWLMAVPIFVVFFLCVLQEKSVTRLIFGADPYQYVTYWAGWVQTGLFALAAMLSHVYFDYVRIYTVINDETRMNRAWLAGLKFMFGNLGRAFLLAFWMALIGIVVMAIYNLLANQLVAANALVVLMLFLAQQVYIFFRMYMKLTAFAAQTALYQKVSTAGTVAAADSASGNQAMGGAVPAAE